MKKYLALPLLVVMCSQSWAAGSPATAPEQIWEPALTPADVHQAQPAPEAPASPASDTSKAPAAQPVSQGASAQASPAAAGSESAPASDALPPPSPLYKAAESQVSPLTPDEVRALRGKKSQIDKALKAPAMTVVPRISSLTVSLSPGSSIPLVRCAVKNSCDLSFTDATGAPWPVSKAINPNDEDFSVAYAPGGPVVSVFPRHAYSQGNISVFLKGLNVPVKVNLSSGDTDNTSSVWTIDSRLDLRIPRRGPSATALAAPTSKIALYDDQLQAFLDGTPPREARRLKATGGVPDTSVWQLGDDLYIRSRANILDEFDQTLSSADGMHLWKLPVTPYVSFAVMGRTVPLNINLE